MASTTVAGVEAPALNRLGITRATLLPAICTGAIVGLLVLVTSISYPALIFSGELAPYAGIGARLGLFAGIVFCLTLALTSSFPGAVGVGQAEPAVALGVITASMAEMLAQAGASAQLLPTVLITIALSALLTGACFVTLGGFKLGNLIRFIPFPVIGGFLAGIGWLLLQGGLRTLTGSDLALHDLSHLIVPEQIIRWLPGVILAGLLIFLQRRRRHALNMPVVVLGATLLFWTTAWLVGAAPNQLRADGWLLGSGPASAAWLPFQSIAMLPDVHWETVWRHVPQLGSVVIISLVTLLLIASSLELVARRDVDLNRELLAAGGANLLSGLFGTLPGYQSLSGCTLASKLGTPVRPVGIVAALVLFLAFYFGDAMLAVLPKLLVGIVLLYVGVDLLLEWLRGTWSRLPLAEYLVLLLVFAAVSFVGLLQGVGIGIVAGVVLFVVNYSRITVVRSIGSGATMRSNVQRPEALRNLLHQHGGETHVLILQGYIFFGTANRLLQDIRARMSDPQGHPLGALVLDFRRVTGLDSSAMASFAKLAQYAEQSAFLIAFTRLPQECARALQQAGLYEGQHPAVRAFADLDQGLEFAEDRILEAREGTTATFTDPLEQQLRRAFPESTDIVRLMGYLEKTVWRPGEQLIRQGDASSDLFFIESGRVTVQLMLAGGGHMRLGAVGAGTVLGEVALYLGLPRSASVIADGATVAYRLSKERLQEMKQERPDLAAMFHEFMARTLASRLLDTNRLLESYGE